jgi:thioredoxin reductase
MFMIKQNDTLPHLEAQLFDTDGNPINLDLCGVRLQMQHIEKLAYIDRAVTITDTEQGKVRVEWQEGETSIPGIYKAEFKVNMPDSKVLTIPNDRHFFIEIIRELRG